MLVKKSNVDAPEGSDSGEDDDNDPMKDQFLNKLSAMNERVKIYNEAFYDREPRYMHVSPQIVLTKAQNKTKQLVERRKLNVLDGTQDKSVTL